MVEFATLNEKIEMLELKVDRLEQMLFAKINSDNMSKQYTDADINGTRQSISNITPFVLTKQAYFGDSQVTFYDVPEGNVSVFFDSYLGPYSFERVGNMLTVLFDTLTVASTNITISIQ